MLKSQKIPDIKSYKLSANRRISLREIGREDLIDWLLEAHGIEHLDIDYPTRVLVDYATYSAIAFKPMWLLDYDDCDESIVFVTFETIITEDTIYYQLEHLMGDDEKHMWLVQMTFDAMGYRDGKHFMDGNCTQDYMDDCLPDYRYDDRELGFVYDLLNLISECDYLEDARDSIFEVSDHIAASMSRDDLFEWAKYNSNYIQNAHDNFGELPSEIENAIQWGVIEEVNEVLGEFLWEIERMV
jgi:hypothetical protein